MGLVTDPVLSVTGTLPDGSGHVRPGPMENLRKDEDRGSERG